MQNVMSRLKELGNSRLSSKMRVYNGENLKELDPNAKSILEYKEDAGVTEGMAGISTRFAFKILSKVFNYDQTEIAANPVHLLYVLEQEIIRQQFTADNQDKYMDIIKGLGNQGLMEFVEMFKAPIKVLHPLLTATQEKNYKGTEPIGAIPFNGVILAHSNESEWSKFSNDKKNEAFLDRVYMVRVPYSLRVDEEIKIYEKLVRESSLSEAPCSPKTLDILSQFTVPIVTGKPYLRMLRFSHH